MKNLILKSLLSVFIFVCFPLGLSSAHADGFGIEILGLNMHIIDSAVQWGSRSPRKLDDSGRFVYLPGWELYWEHETKDKIFLNADGYRFTIAQYRDTMDQLSGYIHAGLRWKFHIDSKRLWSVGLGPSLFFRESWRVFSDYNPHQLLLESDTFLPGYEYMWIIWGDIDFQYKISNDLKLVVSILPAIPYSILFSMGVFWGY